jgi:uncharacterized protein YraI
MRNAVRLILLLAGLSGLGFVQPAFASGITDLSTPAWTNHDLRLYVGPGNNYQVRTILPGGLRIGVERCSHLWCRIHAGRERGYVFLYSLSFGQGPNSQNWPPQARHPGIHAWGYVRSEPRF